MKMFALLALVLAVSSQQAANAAIDDLGGHAMISANTAASLDSISSLIGQATIHKCYPHCNSMT